MYSEDYNKSKESSGMQTVYMEELYQKLSIAIFEWVKSAL